MTDTHDAIRTTQVDKVPWWHWHRRLYDWVIHWSHTNHAQTALFLLSFSESRARRRCRAKFKWEISA